jgi:glycosyltransferase involved in cell wall biosynthesis
LISKKKRLVVFLLQDLIPSYRVPVFRHLAASSGIDLTVFYSQPTCAHSRDNLRNAANLSGFASVRLPRLQVGTRAYQFAFFRHVSMRRPDIVILGQMGRLDTTVCLILCKLLRIPVLWFLGGVPFVDPERIREFSREGKLNRWFGAYNPVRWLSFRANGMIVYSEHARGYFGSLGFPKSRIWVAPNSPDTCALREAEERLLLHTAIVQALRTRYAPRGEKVIFMLGRLNRGRRVDVLLDAFRTLRNEFPGVVLLIVGDGPERAELESIARAIAPSRIHFIGALYEDDALAPYFLLCDIFVTPGIASLALKFAMSFGKPVVTADYGLEVHAVENSENGYVVSLGDPEALASALLRLLRDDALRVRMGDNARKTIDERVNIDTMIQGFQDAINSVGQCAGHVYPNR